MGKIKNFIFYLNSNFWMFDPWTSPVNCQIIKSLFARCYDSKTKTRKNRIKQRFNISSGLFFKDFIRQIDETLGRKTKYE